MIKDQGKTITIVLLVLFVLIVLFLVNIESPWYLSWKLLLPLVILVGILYTIHEFRPETFSGSFSVTGLSFPWERVKEFLILIGCLLLWFLLAFGLYTWLTPSSWWGHEPKQEIVQTTEVPTYSQPVQGLPKVSGYQLPLESGIYRLQKGIPYWWYRNSTIRMDILAKEETNAILTYRRKDSDIYWKQRLSNLGFVDILESNDDKQQGEYFVISDQDVDVKIVILDR